MFYNNTSLKIRSFNGDTDFFNIVAGVLQWDTLEPCLFIISQDYVLRTLIYLIKENGVTLKEARSRGYHAEIFTDADYADDIALRANTPTQGESLLGEDSSRYWPPREYEENGLEFGIRI